MNGTNGLPDWRSVLVVVAHPDDESFGLGALIDSFGRAGATMSLLCLTHGEASTLHGVAGDLREIREAELRAAALALGIVEVQLATYPDGALSSVSQEELVALVDRIATSVSADGFLVFDPSGITGHPDHVAATAAAMTAGQRRGTDVLGWTLPATVATQLAAEFHAPFVGHQSNEVDFVIPVNRDRQLTAVTCHPSQAIPTSVLWRRLELLGDSEHLRWL